MTATAPTDPAGAGGAPASTETATPTPSAPPEADFIQRAQTDPKWASEQVTAFQSRADSAEAANKKLVDQYEPMQALVDEFDAKTIKAVFENYRSLRNSEGLGEMIVAYENTGQLPARKGSAPAGNDDEDEYQTPEERTIAELTARLSQVESSTNANTLASGKETMVKHMDRVLLEHGFVPEDVEQLRATITTQIDSWALQGDKGLTALKSLGGPNGYSTVKGILLSGASPEAFQRAAENLALRRQKGLSNLATDDPSRVLSTGQEAPKEFADYKAAAKYFAAHPEQNTSV